MHGTMEVTLPVHRIISKPCQEALFLYYPLEQMFSTWPFFLTLVYCPYGCLKCTCVVSHRRPVESSCQNYVLHVYFFFVLIFFSWNIFFRVTNTIQVAFVLMVQLTHHYAPWQHSWHPVTSLYPLGQEVMTVYAFKLRRMINYNIFLDPNTENLCFSRTYVCQFLLRFFFS